MQINDRVRPLLEELDEGKERKKRERKEKRKKRTSFHEVVNFEVGVSIYVHLKYDGHEDRFSSFSFFFYIYI